jgi:hypothetical protein
VATVELAILLPVLSLFVFATVEMGLAWVAHNEVSSAVAHSARIGAAGGGRPQADRDLLLTLRASLPAEQLAGVDRVVVYKASDPSGAVPAGCIKAVSDPSEAGTSLCNSYSGATVRSVTAGSMAGFTGAPGGKDAFWPPAGRHDSLDDPPDYLGVWLRTTYSGLTGFSFANVTVTASSVFRIQPDLNG